MAESRFVYVIYIRTTPEELWKALLSPDFAEKYWRGARPESEWRVGAAWALRFPDGRMADSGEIIEFEPQRRIVLKWRNEWSSELNAEGYSSCTMQIEETGEAVKLTITHSIDREGSKLIEAVSSGWPQILSNLKSLLETGSVVLPPMKSR